MASFSVGDPLANSTEAQIVSSSDFPLDSSIKNPFACNLKGKIVHVRGFWYPLSSNEGILAKEPHLKSCCIKAPSKITQQIFVKNAPFSLSPGRAVTLEGLFTVEPRYSPDGELVQFYVLEGVREVSKRSEGFSFELGVAVFGFFLLLLALCIFIFFRFMKSRS